jgi:hypothetical protein
MDCPSTEVRSRRRSIRAEAHAHPIQTREADMTFSRILRATLPLVLLVCAFPALAQHSPPPPDCRVVQAVGNDHKPQILAGLNDTVAGLEKDINPRKTMRIVSVEDIAFDGCKVTTTARIELGRKIRRDAEGTATVTGRVASISLRDRVLCFDKHPKVARMNLSRTTELGERIYEWVANKVHPVDKCVAFAI